MLRKGIIRPAFHDQSKTYKHWLSNESLYVASDRITRRLGQW